MNDTQLPRGGRTAYRLVRHGVDDEMRSNRRRKSVAQCRAGGFAEIVEGESGEEEDEWEASTGVSIRALTPTALDFRALDGARAEWCMKLVQNGARRRRESRGVECGEEKEERVARTIFLEIWGAMMRKLDCDRWTGGCRDLESVVASTKVGLWNKSHIRNIASSWTFTTGRSICCFICSNAMNWTSTISRLRGLPRRISNMSTCCADSRIPRGWTSMSRGISW